MSGVILGDQSDECAADGTRTQTDGYCLSGTEHPDDGRGDNNQNQGWDDEAAP